MTIAQHVFRARTVYIVALAWIVTLVLVLAAGVDIGGPDSSPFALAFVTVGGVIELGTIVFAIWQFGHWVGNRLARPPGRLRRFAKGYVLPACLAAAAILSVTSPFLLPTPTAEQMMELHGTVTSVLVRGTGTSTRGDFAVGGQSLLFWTDRGYGRLAKGADVRFFVQAEQGRPKQALNGSVHAYAVAVDGEGVETLQAALSRNRIYQIQLIPLGLLLGALAIFTFRIRGRTEALQQA